MYITKVQLTIFSNVKFRVFFRLGYIMMQQSEIILGNSKMRIVIIGVGPMEEGEIKSENFH